MLRAELLLHPIRAPRDAVIRGHWGSRVSAWIVQMFSGGASGQAGLVCLQPFLLGDTAASQTLLCKITSGEQQRCACLHQTVQLLGRHSFNLCGEGNGSVASTPYIMHILLTLPTLLLLIPTPGQAAGTSPER